MPLFGEMREQIRRMNEFEERRLARQKEDRFFFVTCERGHRSQMSGVELYHHLRFEKDEQLLCPECYAWVKVSTITELPPDMQGKVVKLFYCLYVDGYGDTETSESILYIFDGFVRMSTHYRQEVSTYKGKTIALDIPYESIRLLNISLDREITAARTLLIGAFLAAHFKQETLTLNIGFVDERGLLQIPSFKMEKNEVHDCYRLINERTVKAKRM